MFEEYTYTLPTWSASYLVNGDQTANTAEEGALLEEFEATLNDEHGAGRWHIAWPSEDDGCPYFSPDNDLGSLAGECEDVKVMVKVREV